MYFFLNFLHKICIIKYRVIAGQKQAAITLNIIAASITIPGNGYMTLLYNWTLTVMMSEITRV